MPIGILDEPESPQQEEQDSTEEHFKQFYPLAASSSAEFITLAPYLPSGDDLPPIHCFLHLKELFVKADNNIARSTFLQLVDLAKSKGTDRIYMSIERDTPDLTKVVKMLMFLGFKQVPPESARQFCTTPAVLLRLNF